MIPVRRLAALVPLLALSAWAGPLQLDAGLRASIYDENYKLGVGGELGAVVPASSQWDFGLHLNYSHFAPKTDTWTAADEYGGYVAAYFKPAIDQGFSLRLGPHIGYSKIRKNYLDVGGDVMAVFKVTPSVDIYGAFIPAYFIGPTPQSLIRIGFGAEFRVGG